MGIHLVYWWIFYPYSLITERCPPRRVAIKNQAEVACNCHTSFLFGVVKILGDIWGILGGVPYCPQNRVPKSAVFVHPCMKKFHTFNLFCPPNWNFVMISGVTKANPFVALTSLRQKSCNFLYLPWICQCYHPATQILSNRTRARTELPNGHESRDVRHEKRAGVSTRLLSRTWKPNLILWYLEW